MADSVHMKGSRHAVQHGKHDGTVVGTQGLNECGVNIGFHDFVSDPPQV
jgi:hypothetical protein